MGKDYHVNSVVISEIVINNARIQNNTDHSSISKIAYAFNFYNTFSFGVNIEEKKCRVTFESKISTITKDNSEDLDITGSFEIIYFFNIESLLDFVDEKTGEITNVDMLVSLSNIVYSTSRGIMYTRCQGTILKDLILPILSTDDIVTMLSQKPISQ